MVQLVKQAILDFCSDHDLRVLGWALLQAPCSAGSLLEDSLSLCSSSSLLIRSQINQSINQSVNQSTKKGRKERGKGGREEGREGGRRKQASNQIHVLNTLSRIWVPPYKKKKKKIECPHTKQAPLTPGGVKQGYWNMEKIPRCKVEMKSRHCCCVAIWTYTNVWPLGIWIIRSLASLPL